MCMLRYISSVVPDTIVWRTPPSRKTVLVNSTTFLPCRAAFNNQYDLVYRWKFHGREINYDIQKNFVQVRDTYLFLE